MGAPEAFRFQTVDFLWSRPAFGCLENDHGPRGGTVRRSFACVGLRVANVVKNAVERCGHQPVHCRRIIAFNEVRLVAVTDEQAEQFLDRYPRENGWSGDLVAIEMQDWQNRTIPPWVKKLIGVPGCRH